MKIFSLNRHDRSSSEKLSVSIGVFDGVHLGHQKILKQLLKFSPSAVITFYKHPRTGIRLIQSFSQRLRVFKDMGINSVHIISKQDDLLHLSTEDFVSRYLKPLGVERIIVGTDFRLGHNRDTDVEKFTDICASHGMVVEKIDVVLEDHNRKLSSTEIREKITKGEIKEVNVMLGRPFYIQGFVVRGAGLGGKIGFSTANINPHPLKHVIPANGVYRTRSTILGSPRTYESMTYVGTNPTLKGGRYYSIETHIPGFSEDLHGRVMKVEFLARIRNEMKFASVEELVSAIEKDIKEGMTV